MYELFLANAPCALRILACLEFESYPTDPKREVRLNALRAEPDDAVALALLMFGQVLVRGG